MPTRMLEGDVPVVEFDPRCEVSPYTLFRRLREDRAPVLIDVRPPGALGATLRGAIAMPVEWSPPDSGDVVLFDDDGNLAVPLARQLLAAGHENVRALFGGLELYGFALDPRVVGADTFLILEPEPRAEIDPQT